MYRKHPFFRQPLDGSEKLWRYMDIPKFLALLNSETLHFTRADRFDDPFEGAATKLDLRRREQQQKAFIDFWAKKGKVLNLTSGGSKLDVYPVHRKFVAINCWHSNPFESAAMWDLYSRRSEGVAILSSWDRLKASIIDDCDVLVGRVSYIDRESAVTDDANILNFYLQKVKSFEHEREVRAITVRVPHAVDFELPSDLNSTVETIPVSGVPVKIKVDTLIEKVFVAPTAARWHSTLIHDLIKKYNYSFDVTQSSLYTGLM